MAKGLQIAAPPPRRPPTPSTISSEPPTQTEEKPAKARAAAGPGDKFSQIREDEMVQFNKRVPRRVADGFEILAIRCRRKVPGLLAEALELLEQHYGKV
jgi:hypothetical protein